MNCSNWELSRLDDEKFQNRLKLSLSAGHDQLMSTAADSPSTVRSLVEECLQCMVEDKSQFWEWRFNSRIHYRTAGSTGPAIVLVHGFGVASFQFQPLMDELSKVRLFAITLQDVITFTHKQVTNDGASSPNHVKTK